jgi:hypothetical protein
VSLGIIRRLAPILVLMGCDPWSRADAQREAAQSAAREAAADEAERRAQADAAFAALTAAEHLENARVILRSTDDDPLATAESRRMQLERAQRHLRAIPPGVPGARAAAELDVAIANERAKLLAQQ